MFNKDLGIMSLFAGKVHYISGLTGFTGVSIDVHTLKNDLRSEYEHKYRENWARKAIKEFYLKK